MQNVPFSLWDSFLEGSGNHGRSCGELASEGLAS